jgi:[ribosomal protein S18]-alanine N-acetyltransferase
VRSSPAGATDLLSTNGPSRWGGPFVVPTHFSDAHLGAVRHHVGVPLLPFSRADAELVSSWGVGDEVVRAWCAVEGDSVPAEVVAGWSQADDVEAYVFGDDDGDPVAYGELWLDPEEGEVELARLIVHPGLRGRGIGRALVTALVEQARRTHPELPAILLRVRPENAVAIRSYTAAGFVAVPAGEQAAWNRGQRFDYHWMVLPR